VFWGPVTGLEDAVLDPVLSSAPQRPLDSWAP